MSRSRLCSQQVCQGLSHDNWKEMWPGPFEAFCCFSVRTEQQTSSPVCHFYVKYATVVVMLCSVIAALCFIHHKMFSAGRY